MIFFSFSCTKTEKAKIWDWFKCYFKAIPELRHSSVSPDRRIDRKRERKRERDVKTQFERRNSKIVVRPTAATLRRTSKWNYATLHAGTLGQAQRLVCRGHSTTICLKGPKPLIVSRLTSIKRYLMNKTFLLPYNRRFLRRMWIGFFDLSR